MIFSTTIIIPSAISLYEAHKKYGYTVADKVHSS